MIENPTAYQKKLEWLGQRKRRFEAWHVERSTTFRGIPKGKYFVHLYGIYTRGRQVLVLNEPYEQVEVLARKTAFVAFNLEASEAEFKITVMDDSGPVDGARLWVDQDRAKAVATPKEGNVTLKVPKGYHVIHVTARGISVERPYHVIKAKVHEMTINLVWERRQEHASRALERQVDDALPYLTVSRKPRPSQGRPLGRPAASASMGAAARATGDAIEIPMAGGVPAGFPAGSIQGPLGRPAQAAPTRTAQADARADAGASSGRRAHRPCSACSTTPPCPAADSGQNDSSAAGPAAGHAEPDERTTRGSRCARQSGGPQPSGRPRAPKPADEIVGHCAGPMSRGTERHFLDFWTAFEHNLFMFSYKSLDSIRFLLCGACLLYSGCAGRSGLASGGTGGTTANPSGGTTTFATGGSGGGATALPPEAPQLSPPAARSAVPRPSPPEAPQLSPPAARSAVPRPFPPEAPQLLPPAARSAVPRPSPPEAPQLLPPAALAESLRPAAQPE